MWLIYLNLVPKPEWFNQPVTNQVCSFEVMQIIDHDIGITRTYLIDDGYQSLYQRYVEQTQNYHTYLINVSNGSPLVTMIGEPLNDQETYLKPSTLHRTIKVSTKDTQITEKFSHQYLWLRLCYDSKYPSDNINQRLMTSIQTSKDEGHSSIRNTKSEETFTSEDPQLKHYLSELQNAYLSDQTLDNVTIENFLSYLDTSSTD